ncbi:hypothetical protein [uncultured Mediterranean phage]|jgi:hypothetical protein|nr:hypothetical protein [uncultured Mediterranean phage]
MPSTIARMGTPYASQIVNLRGGLNNAVNDEMVGSNELSEVVNFVPDTQDSGILIKRLGITQKSSQQSESITSVFDGYAGDYFTTKTTIRNLAGTAVDSSLTSKTDPDWARFDDDSLGKIDIFVNGAEERRSSDGTSWANVSNMPNAKFIVSYNRFLFVAGHDASKVRWSDPEDAETWDTDNEFVFDEDVTGMAVFRGGVYVFTEFGFHVIQGYGEKTMQIVGGSQEAGCTSHRSIVSSPYGLFWWSANGMMWSPDGVRVVNISRRKIPGTLNLLDSTQNSLVHGIYNPLIESVSMWVFNTDSTTQDRRIDYFPGEVGEDQMGSFWVHTGAGIQMGASGIVLESGKPVWYVGSAGTSGYLYEQKGDTDDGTPIEGIMETRRETAELGMHTLKRTKQLTPQFILTGTTTATYGVYIDNDATLRKTWDITVNPIEGFVLDVDALGAGRLGAGSEGFDKSLYYNVRWRKIKHRISDTSAFRTRVRGIINEGTVLSA